MNETPTSPVLDSVPPVSIKKNSIKKVTWISGTAILLVLAAGGGWAYMHNQQPKTVASAPSFSWVFEPAGYSSVDTSRPITKVSLVVSAPIAKTFSVGTYEAVCSVEQEPIDVHELSSAICWWAGAGKEIGVFTEGATYVVKEGDVGEGGNLDEAYRNNFHTLFEVK